MGGCNGYNSSTCDLTMDIETARALELLDRIDHEITIPTATGLLCDVLGVIACEARVIISSLISMGYFTCDLGGWLKRTESPRSLYTLGDYL